MANFNNIVIDRILRGTMFSTADGSILWSLTQITNPSLNISAETTDAVDALGTPIMTFNRAKTAEFSAENSLFDLSLAAAQAGTDKKVAGKEQKLVVPIFEEVEVGSNPTEPITLKFKAKDAIPFVYLLNGDSTLATKYQNGGSATGTDFIHKKGTNTLTPPTGLKTGDRLFVEYEYETPAAVEVYNTSNDFPKAGRFVMEVLGADVCDPTTLMHMYIEFPNAKLTSDVDMTFTTEGTHPFTLRANVAYCDKNKRLFSIIVPDEDVKIEG